MMRRLEFSVLYEVLLMDLRWKVGLPRFRVIVVVAVVETLDAAVVPPLLPGHSQESLLWRRVVAGLSVLTVLYHRNTILAHLVSPLVRTKCFPIVPLLSSFLSSFLPPFLSPVQCPLLPLPPVESPTMTVVLPTLPVRCFPQSSMTLVGAGLTRHPVTRPWS